MAEIVYRFQGIRRVPVDRMLLYALAWLVVMLWLAAPLAQAGTSDTVASGQGYSGADYWREVTRGESGYTPVAGAENGVLINRAGEAWRRTRLEQVLPAGQWILAGTLGLLGVFYLLVGKNRLHFPRSGETVERWKKRDRWLHWCLAGLFLILAISGLSIMYGKFFLLELMGKGGFGDYLQAAKLAHNYLGPLFAVNLLLVLLLWLRNNWITGLDLRWFVQGGGMIKGKHPSAGYMNGGEKLWFWILILGGTLISLSGVVMDFPNLEPLREDLQLANLVHGIASLALICASFGHIYIGSIGTEGALEGMVSGRVDKSWARQHHDLWARELEARETEERRRS